MLPFFKLFRSLQRIPFVRDVATMQLGTFVYLAATFASSIIVARLLGVEHYGIYAVALAFTGTVNIFLNVGQGTSLLVFFAEEYGKKDKQGMATVLRNYLHLSLLNSIVLLALAATAPLLTKSLHGREDIGWYCSLLFLFDLLDIWNSATLILFQAIRSIRLKVILEQAANLGVIGLSVLAVLSWVNLLCVLR